MRDSWVSAPDFQQVRISDTTTPEELSRVLCHDLGGPSRALRQYLVMLTRARDLGQDQLFDQTMQRMGGVLDRLDRVLDEFSDLCRLPENTLSIAPTPVIMDVAESFGLQVAVTTPLFSWPCGRETAHTIIMEILKNVRDHAQGPVDVRAMGARVEFCDAGRGIACETRDVFTPFRPVHPVGSPNRGLGLARVSLLMHSIGGSVVLDSSGGTGTVAELTFPHDGGTDTSA